MQYTLRGVPPALHAELRRRSRAEGKSLNTVAIEALARGAGLAHAPLRQRDLSDVVGTWREDRAFQRAVANQHRIDKRLWR